MKYFIFYLYSNFHGNPVHLNSDQFYFKCSVVTCSQYIGQRSSRPSNLMGIPFLLINFQCLKVLTQQSNFLMNVKEVVVFITANPNYTLSCVLRPFLFFISLSETSHFFSFNHFSSTLRVGLYSLYQYRVYYFITFLLPFF